MEAPRDIAAERQVIGALLVRPDLLLEISQQIGPSDFFLEPHRILFESLTEIRRDDPTREIDPLQLIQFLGDRKKLERVGGGDYILRLAEDVMAPAGAAAHARRLKNLSLRRDLVEAAVAIQEDASRPFQDEQIFLKQVEDRILNITNRSFVQGVWSIKDLKNEFIEHVQTLIESRGRQTGLVTHLHEFDNLTTGLKGGELVVLAARPGMGKTTLAMNIASNVAVESKKNVLVFSLEMSRLELLLRLVSSRAQFNHSDLKRGNIQSRHQDILNSIEEVFGSPLHIDDTGDLSIWDCILRSRKLAIELDQRGESLGLIIVDYLQLLSDPDARRLGRQHEVAMISRSLKQLAKHVNVPVMALSQMNRSVEQRRGDQRPQLSDLRESGAIEQDADIVMFIHRDQPGEPETPEALENRGTAEIIVAKHRNGPVGNFRLAYRPELNRFDNLA